MTPTTEDEVRGRIEEIVRGLMLKASGEKELRRAHELRMKEGVDAIRRLRAEASGEVVPEDEIQQIVGYAKQKMKHDLNPVDSYERYCERIEGWLADRHPSTEGDDE